MPHSGHRKGRKVQNRKQVGFDREGMSCVV